MHGGIPRTYSSTRHCFRKQDYTAYAAMSSQLLFWDIENANIPWRRSFSWCVDHLRDLAEERGFVSSCRMRIVCGGSRCSETVCFYGHSRKLCDPDTEDCWEPNEWYPTTENGVELLCGWMTQSDNQTGRPYRNNADNIIVAKIQNSINELKRHSSQTLRLLRAKFMVFTKDQRLQGNVENLGTEDIAVMAMDPNFDGIRATGHTSNSANFQAGQLVQNDNEEIAVPSWLQTAGKIALAAGLLGVGAVAVSALLNGQQRPVRLFWDIDNARCAIPANGNWQGCIAHLRGIGRQQGVDLDTTYGIKVICRGSGGGCTYQRCVHASTMCDLQTQIKWRAGAAQSTTMEGVLLQCGCDGRNDSNSADDRFVEQLTVIFSATSAGMNIILVTENRILRGRAARTVNVPYTQRIIFHPANPEDPVWPLRFDPFPPGGPTAGRRGEECVIT
ncbi:uncharacterized protein LOC129584279 isoform X2 [Paramacrobiotus metropolitanus]|nr:uncharacterized protein LOC129584279 isoform X2 [Paramacrobiotus metropolitanus]